MKKLILTSLCVLFVTGTALADWKLGDPYKMHFPQLPDPNGWDVSSTNTILADDWQCSESGLVNDIHFWVSFKGPFEPSEGFVGPDIHVEIHSNIIDGGDGYSVPGGMLWERTFKDDQYEGDYAGSGNQGWYDSAAGVYIPNDHTAYYLLNIDSIADPLFPQVAGTIYWLEIQLTSETTEYEVGWKTADVNEYPEPHTGEHFMDDAVWWDGAKWQELYDPLDPAVSLDMAFVITPEPATIALLGLGSLALLRKKRRA